MTNLEDLIKEGIRIQEERAARERAERLAEQERMARDVEEARAAILALLPEALQPLAEVEVKSYGKVKPLYGEARIPIGSGRVVCYANFSDGAWRFVSDDDYYRRLGQITFDAWNPAGYYRWFLTLEEAVAYAAGRIS